MASESGVERRSPGFDFSRSIEALWEENAPNAGIAILEGWPGLFGIVLISLVDHWLLTRGSNLGSAASTKEEWWINTVVKVADPVKTVRLLKELAYRYCRMVSLQSFSALALSEAGCRR